MKPTAPADPRPPRRARTLSAWLTEQQVARLDSSAVTPERHRAAGAALAARAAGVPQSDLIGDWPSALEPHAAALRASAGAQRMFQDGWRLALITDLRRVVAAQPTVLVDDAVRLAAPPTAGVATLEDLARLALPLEPRACDIRTRFDAEQQHWIITSPDPNVRITATFGTEVRPNVVGVGFFFEVLNSFVSVAEVNGRYVLRDGYHRCYRLMTAGVTAVPAFVRRYGDQEPVFTSPMLDRDIWCGPKPPTLADYDDDRVADDVTVTLGETTAVVAAGPRRLSLAGAPAAA